MRSIRMAVRAASSTDFLSLRPHTLMGDSFRMHKTLKRTKTAKPRHRSSISKTAKECVVEKSNVIGGIDRPEKRKYLVGAKVVGIRLFDLDGTLQIERPIKDGHTHGIYYEWHECGALSCAEPYRHGLPHGLSKQWDTQGRLAGTWKMRHGTGFDLWWSGYGDGPWTVSEVRTLKEGKLHGFEWWLNPDGKSVWEELHWWENELHGIHRVWKSARRLNRGYPKFYVHGKPVTKHAYGKAAALDQRLPSWCKADDFNRRTLPEPLLKAIADGSVKP